MKYFLLVGVLWIGLVHLTSGQSGADLRLGYDPLVCVIDTSAASRVLVVQNFNIGNDLFNGGSYTINWGDGSEEAFDIPELSHGYKDYSSYTITLSWTSGEGVTVRNTFPFTLKRKPTAGFSIPSSGSCVNQETILQIDGYDKESPETRYYFSCGTRELGNYGQAEVVSKQGVIKHYFREKICNEYLKLTVSNECVEKGYIDEELTASLRPFTVMAPVEIDFKAEPAPACTGIPFVLRIDESKLDVCGARVDYTWNLQGQGGYSGTNPPVRPYEQTGTYDITLTAKVVGYACAMATVTKQLEVIRRVTADWEVAEDTLCYAGTPVSVSLKNLSSGDSLRFCQWRVNGNVLQTTEDYDDFELSVRGPGVYRVEMIVDNGCSSEVRDTNIVVKQSPEVVYFNLSDQDSVCPQTDEGFRLHMEDYIGYNWHGNPVAAHWEITPEEGVTFEPGAGPDTPYPHFTLKPGRTYRMKVRLDRALVNGVICGDPSAVEATRILKVHDPRIFSDISAVPAADGQGIIRVCAGEEVVFTNHSTGENLKHRWTVVPVEGSRYDSNWADKIKIAQLDKADQSVLFKAYGDYLVTDTLKVECNTLPVVFRVHVAKAPSVTYFDLGKDTLICAGTGLDLSRHIVYAWANNDEQVEWSCTPEPSSSWERSAVYPLIGFPDAGTYRLRVSLPERGCASAATISEKELVLRVRSTDLSSEVELAGDGYYCEGNRLQFINTVDDDEGVDGVTYTWWVKPAGGIAYQPESSAAILFEEFPQYGDYEVTGTAEGYCDVKSDTVRFVIHKDPAIQLLSSAICPGPVAMDSLVSYFWYNNSDRTVNWNVAGPVDGAEGPVDVLTPDFLLKKAGDYHLTVEINGAACPQNKVEARQVVHVYDTMIYGDIVPRGMGTGVDPGDLCEGDSVTFINTTVAERSLRYLWTVEGPEGGYRFRGDETASAEAEPVIRFVQYGNYTVKAVVREGCNTKIFTFPVIVRGVPGVVLSGDLGRICQGDSIEMEPPVITYPDAATGNKNNILTYSWSVWKEARAAQGVTIAAPEEAYTRIIFNEGAHYQIQLEVGMKCADGSKKVLSSEIEVTARNAKALFTVGQDSVGCVNDPQPYEITLDGSAAVGNPLTYTWSVEPATGVQFTEGDEHTPVSRLLVTEEGNYNIRLEVGNGCNRDDSVFTIKAFGVPAVEISDIIHQCEPFRFVGQEQITNLNKHNDELTGVSWEFRANTEVLAGEYEYLNGTDGDSFFPDIDFRHCDYTVYVEYANRCLTPGRDTFQVLIDRFIPIAPLAHDSICALAAPRLLQAQPDTGIWSLAGEALPDGDKILYRQGGQYYFHPVFAAYEEKDIPLVYKLQNFSCIDRDTLMMHVWPLPFVDVRDTLKMCRNDSPVLLSGRDSSANGHWQINRGVWKSGDDTIRQHIFVPVNDGSFPLRYDYTDRHGCRNEDSLQMVVHPLPVTDFSVEPLNCIHTEVLFTPADAEGNIFEWSFGDGSLHRYSENEIRHEYGDYGFRDVVCMATSSLGCMDTSEVRRIEIVNNPPAPFFEVDTLDGCPPFQALISVDRSRYADNHNYLSFHWDYGDGTETDTLGPIVPKGFPDGLWDTTYITRFTVSNMCDTLSYEKQFTVYSVPKISFALMHEWECSPVVLELQNTTTGDECLYHWTFTNGRTGEVVERTDIRNPVHEFVTDSAATTFYIHLSAENKCNEDTFRDSLVVKPRTVSAHFTPLDHAYACVNQDIFFRNNSSDTSAFILSTYWNFGDGEKTDEWSPVHRYDAEGVYTVSLKIHNGCGWDTISAPVTIYPLPHLQLESRDYFCEGDTLPFILRSDQELATVRWEFGDGGVRSKDSVLYAYQASGAFGLKVTGVSAEINQCTDSVIKQVTVNPKPVVNIWPLDTASCSPMHYVPRVEGDAYLNWDYGDGSGWIAFGEHWYENSSDSVQRFTVKIIAESDQGCKDRLERHVTIYNLPRAVLDKKVEKGNPQKVTFLNLSQDCANAIWELPGGKVVNSLEDQTVELTEGTYSASLVAGNLYQCRDTAYIEHKVLIKGLYFPNSFIPHSQNNKVNRFNGIGIALRYYKLEIFDQYYNKIWETRALQNGQPSEGWDGCNFKGEVMPQGLYIWRAEAIFADDEIWTGDNNDSGVSETTQGTVLLLRE